MADLRRNALLLSGLTVAVTAGAAGSVWVAYRLGNTHAAAFIAGFYIMLWLSLIGFFFVVTGTFARRLGGTAEQWTSQIFGRLKRSGWAVFDNVPFDGFDVDHIVVGPRQVLAVETKWTSMTLDARDNGHLQGLPPGWVRQARKGARSVERLLANSDLDFKVSPVLVLWGTGVARTEKGWFKTGNVTVLVGNQSRHWRGHLENGSWTRQATHTVPPVIEAHVKASMDAPLNDGLTRQP